MPILAISALYFLFPSRALANPADAFGFGSRAAAMGGAATAVADDASANYYNPAGLVRGNDLRIDIGYQAALPSLSLNGKNLGVDGTHGFTAGVAAPGHVGPVRLAFGAALFLPDDRLTRVRALSYSQPRFVYYDNRTQRLLLAANLAIQIVPGLYIGGGLSFMSRTQGTVDLKGLISVVDTDAQSQLTTQINVDLVAIRYPQFGVVWLPFPWLTLGASYRHSFTLELDQGFTITGNVGNQGTQPIVQNGKFQVTAISLDLFQPWQLTFALAAHVTRRLLIAFDATYARWSDFQTPASTLIIPQPDLGPTFSKLVMIPPPPKYQQPGFHDIVIPRIGVEYRALQRDRVALDVRGGYSYEQSPVPEQVGDTNYADSDKHRFSVGLGLEARLGEMLPRPLSIDAHFAVTYLPDRYNHKVSPVDPVGDFVAGGYVLEMGLTTRWRF
jgi:long-chain fatty acid transport protein